MADQTYGVGVIGLGAMGKRMVEGFQAHSRFDLRAVYDPQPGEACVPWAASVHSLLENPLVDCVYIATPPQSHAALVADAIAAGKAVLCEKPLTVSVNEADTLVRIAEGKPIAVNFNYATARSAVRLGEIVESAALGSDLTAKLVVRVGRWPRDWQEGATGWLARPEQGGFAREILSHFVFLAQRLFGQGTLEENRVDRGVSGTETLVVSRIRFERATLEIDAAVGGTMSDYNRFEVSGSLSSAAITDWYRLVSPDGTLQPERPDEGQIEAFARLLDSGSSPLATIAEAAAVVRIIEAIVHG